MCRHAEDVVVGVLVEHFLREKKKKHVRACVCESGALCVRSEGKRKGAMGCKGAPSVAVGSLEGSDASLQPGACVAWGLQTPWAILFPV